MAGSGFERFQQAVCHELDKLGKAGRQHSTHSFVELGRAYGIDVIAEVLDKGKSISEIFAMIQERKTKG